MNKPNLFLIGAPKCGTTALAINLSQHPDIYLPEQKEPRYFDRHTFYDYEEDYITKTPEEYLAFYKDSNDSKFLMDASVFNMYKIESIENILELSPDSKFIIILRDPVDASLSMHRQRLTYIDKKMREISEDFNKCWSLLEDRKNGKGYPEGCRNKFLFRYDLLYTYENYLPYLRNKLGDKLFIGFYEDYKREPEELYRKIFNFLGIEAVQIDNQRLNESLTVKDSLILDILHVILKYTLPLRKKIGLAGFKSIRKRVLKLFQHEKIEQEINQEIYDFFEPTYKYIKVLQNEINH